MMRKITSGSGPIIQNYIDSEEKYYVQNSSQVTSENTAAQWEY